MDYVDGESLESLLTKEVLDSELVIDIIIQIASGIEKAHAYDIFHCDLHEGNIMLDKFYNVRIIDFLWRDVITSNTEKNNLDLKAFMTIAKALISKVNPEHYIKFNLINQILERTTSFRGLKKQLMEVWNLSKEFSFLPTESLELLSLIKKNTCPDFKLNMVIQSRKTLVPDQLIPPMTKNEESYLAKTKQGGLHLQFSDSRIERIELNRLFKVAFHPLKNANICDIEVNVYNDGAVFEGPYSYQWYISITVKALQWFEIDDRHSIFSNMPNSDISKYVIETFSKPVLGISYT